MHLPTRCRTHWRLQRNINHMARKSLKILHVAQKAINTRRRNFQSLVLNTINLQSKLQLPVYLFTIFHIDKPLW